MLGGLSKRLRPEDNLGVASAQEGGAMTRHRWYFVIGGVGYLICLIGWVVTQNTFLQTLGLPFLLLFVLAALGTVVKGLRGKK